MKIRAKIDQQEFDIEVFFKFFKKEEVKTSKEEFKELCKKGCKNYGHKWCCPPFAPSFNDYCNKEGIFVVLFKCDLNQINSTKYNRMRIANVVMKSRIDKLMRELENDFKTKFFSSGSCRLCKPCRCPEPCKYPDKKRYSLEATGVDCADLAKRLGVELEWYPSGNSTSTVCGLICNEKEVCAVEKKVGELIKKI